MQAEEKRGKGKKKDKKREKRNIEKKHIKGKTEKASGIIHFWPAYENISSKKKMERKNEKYAFASAKYSEMIFFEVHTQNFKCFYVKKNPGIFISLE